MNHFFLAKVSGKLWNALDADLKRFLSPDETEKKLKKERCLGGIKSEILSHFLNFILAVFNLELHFRSGCWFCFIINVFICSHKHHPSFYPYHIFSTSHNHPSPIMSMIIIGLLLP